MIVAAESYERALEVVRECPGVMMPGSSVEILHRRAGNLEIARQHRARALGSAPTEAVRELLRRRLAVPT